MLQSFTRATSKHQSTTNSAAMSGKEIVLYDLPSKSPCKCWSLNPWKTRLVLNFKKLDYRTEWVEYPDVKPTLEGHVSPNETGMAYTIPAVQLPDSTYLMDSRKIVNQLESQHPQPSLHLDSPVLSKLEAILPELGGALRPAFLPKVPVRLLNQRSQDYWYPTREKMAGMSLDKLDGEKALKDIVAPLKKVSALLNEQEGPFFLGEQVSYADFVFVGFLRFVERIGEDVAGPVMDVDRKAFEGLYKACSKWLERDDH